MLGKSVITGTGDIYGSQITSAINGDPNSNGLLANYACRFLTQTGDTIPTGGTTTYGAVGARVAYTRRIAASPVGVVGNIIESYCQLGIAMEATAVGSEGKVLLAGQTKAMAGGTFAIGDALTIDSSGKFIKIAADDSRFVAIAQSAGADGSLADILFCGLPPFGYLGNAV